MVETARKFAVLLLQFYRLVRNINIFESGVGFDLVIFCSVFVTVVCHSKKFDFCFVLTRKNMFRRGQYGFLPCNPLSDFSCSHILSDTRNTCMQQPLAYISQTLFQHEVFVITPILNASSRCTRHVSHGNTNFLNFLYKHAKNR
jgi:hypothetical protein